MAAPSIKFDRLMTIRLPGDLADAWRDAAKREGVKPAELARDALRSKLRALSHQESAA